MNLQKNTINKFRRIYPKLTYIQISAMAGIQQTRTFRIFNGSEMKITEFEALEKIIDESDLANDLQRKFSSTYKVALLNFSEQKLRKYLNKIQREFQIEAIKGNAYNQFSKGQLA